MSELREQAQQFAKGAAHPVEAAEDELTSARRALSLLAEQGLTGYAVCARDGGRDVSEHVGPETVSVQALCDLRYELARQSGMLDVMFVMQGLGSYAISLGGSSSQREAIMPRVAQGDQIAAFCLTEPEAGSDLSGVATQAEKTDRGWRLSGSKTFISNAPIADVFTVLARTSGAAGDREGLSMFLVNGDSRGLEVRPFEVMAPHPIGDVIFNDVSLTEDALLGSPGGGLEIALQTLSTFRTSVAAAACGFARRALDEAIAHLNSRSQFGRPLAAFQGLRFDLAEMDVRLRASELLVREAAVLRDAGQEAGPEIARAKLYATESASYICDRAVQLFGGRGVRRGEVVERLYREVRALRVYEGTSEVQKLILAKALLA